MVELSKDNALSWAPTKASLPRGTPYKLAVFNDSISNPILFVGGDSGVFFSTNNGDTWIDAGLPNYNIQSIAVMGNYLFAGTYQYGIWRRSISEMIGAATVVPSQPSAQSIASYPNPCTSSSTITFSCAGSGVGEVTIYNLLGAEVARVYEGELSAGEHSFTWDASSAAPGMYECVVRVNGNIQRTALDLLK